MAQPWQAHSYMAADPAARAVSPTRSSMTKVPDSAVNHLGDGRILEPSQEWAERMGSWFLSCFFSSVILPRSFLCIHLSPLKTAPVILHVCDSLTDSSIPRHQDPAFRQRFLNGWMRQKKASRGEKNNSNVAFYFIYQSSISKTTAKVLSDEIILPRQSGRRVSWAVFIEQSIYLGFCCKLFQYWITILADTKSRNMKIKPSRIHKQEFSMVIPFLPTSRKSWSI